MENEISSRVKITRLKTRSFPRIPSDAFAMSKKRNVVLYMDKGIIEESRQLGFNLSKMLENTLKQSIAKLSSTQSTQNGFPSKNEALWWAGPDSDRRPSARQADVLTRLDDRPTFYG